MEHQTGFDKIKEVMTCTPVLALPDPSKPFVLETDASNFAVGAVLLQAGSDGMEHPVAFFSRKMLPAETNYPVHDKEILAIASTLKEWQHHLQNARHLVTIRSDHKSLEYFKSPQRLNQRQSRWHYELALYKFVIEYKRGQLNVIADLLSRDPA